MGLLDSLVNVPERLRVWQLAGVRYFYLDPEAGAGIVSDTSDAPSPEASTEPDPAAWPQAWQAVLAKAPARPRLVITYDALGLDLSGRSDPRRGGLWRALLRDLGLAGRNLAAFWPLSLPEGDGLRPRPDIFLEGLRHLGPEWIAFFGPPAPGLLPLADTAGQIRLLDRFPCLFLPDPAVVLQGDPEVWAHVLATLSSVAD